jgi:hypothetical protein
MRLAIRVALFKHKLLRLCSKSYRQHDAVVSDCERWRRQYIDEKNAASVSQSKAREVEVDAASLRDRLKVAIEGQQRAAEQLIAERALRQAADERSEQYHAELVDALKANADWLAVGLRKPVFGVVQQESREDKPVELPVKKSGRRVAQEVTNETLSKMWDDLRNGTAPEVPVGPEFTTQ